MDQPEFLFQQFPSRRSVVYGTKGIVSSSQPFSTQVGLRILDKGGNAADAAVAISAALTVTEPASCGIGGDAFCLFYHAKTKEIQALNGSGRAPEKLTIEYLNSRGIQGRIPQRDLNSVTVPGAAAAWVDILETFGSGEMELGEILEPAISLAEEGVPVSEIHSHSWQRSEDLLQASPNGNEMLLNGRAPLPGQLIKFPNLAQTFKRLAANGKDGFYKGPIAESIVDLIRSQGGLMDLDDLANHRSTFVEPIKYTYGDVTVYECPPNGQGVTALLALGILEKIQEQRLSRLLMEMHHNSAEYCHTLIEALRLAFSDSQHYVTDPDFEDIPVKEFLSQEYLTSRAQLFDSKRTNPSIKYGFPTGSSDTVYFTGAVSALFAVGDFNPCYLVTDRRGNACSFIQSLSDLFGTGAIPKGCGFTLQNRGSKFSLHKQHPNALRGGKRPYHTIIPALATRGGDLFLSFGVMGGFMQPQGHVQVLLNILRGFNLQAALDAPRFCISEDDPSNIESSSGGDTNGGIYLEDGFPQDTINALRAMGHHVKLATGYDRERMGRGQVIQKLHNLSGHLVWAAGSDPRGDGHAAPQI